MNRPERPNDARRTGETELWLESRLESLNVERERITNNERFRLDALMNEKSILPAVAVYAPGSISSGPRLRTLLTRSETGLDTDTGVPVAHASFASRQQRLFSLATDCTPARPATRPQTQMIR
jgi:hypothetical protein